MPRYHYHLRHTGATFIRFIDYYSSFRHMFYDMFVAFDNAINDISLCARAATICAAGVEDGVARCR